MSIELAEATWGPHPLDWPCPPPRRPYVWQRQTVRRLRELEGVFGYLSDDALQAYWEEVGRGQSVYEDCGGYLERCYRAMIGEEVLLPYTYEAFAADLTKEDAPVTKKEDKIDPSLPHYDVRVFLSEAEAGSEFDRRFAALVGLPIGPEYSSDLNAITSAVDAIGWWWHLSHLEVSVCPVVPAPGLEGLADNAAAYDGDGMPFHYRVTSFRGDNKSLALCKACVKARYNLPDAYYVHAYAVNPVANDSADA